MAPGGVRQSKRVKASGPAVERTSGVSTRSRKRPQTSQEEAANQQLPQECVETPQSMKMLRDPQVLSWTGLLRTMTSSPRPLMEASIYVSNQFCRLKQIKFHECTLTK